MRHCPGVSLFKGAVIGRRHQGPSRHAVLPARPRTRPPNHSIPEGRERNVTNIQACSRTQATKS